MGDHEPFLRSIIAHPDLDGPRLVYADWLEERGECARAEFIRVQVELARLDRCQGCDCFECLLRRRDRELLEAHGTAWSAPIAKVLGCEGRHGCGAALRDYRVPCGCGQEGCTSERTACVAKWEFRRGFVEEVTLTAAQFLGGPCGRCGGRGGWTVEDQSGTMYAYDKECPDCRGTGRLPGLAADLARATPLTEVRLSDREPDLARNHVIGFTYNPEPDDDPFEVGPHPRPRYWSPSDPPHVLPHRLHDVVIAHRTKNVAESVDDCRAWLSRGCVLLARELARSSTPEANRV